MLIEKGDPLMLRKWPFLSFILLGFQIIVATVAMDSKTLLPIEGQGVKNLKKYLPNIKFDALISPEFNQKIISTIESFWYLSDNAQMLSMLPQASSQSLFERLGNILSHLDTFQAPDCPELELLGIQPTPEEIIYQKVNRYLFESVDKVLREKFLASHPNTLFSFPVIEWAVNVMPNFELSTVSKLEENTILESKIKLYIRDHYLPASLEVYFKQGWSWLTERINEILSSNPDNRGELEKELFNRLRCDMCYPTRASILSEALYK